MATKKSQKIGRPSKADKLDKNKLKELYIDGKTDTEIAKIFNISRRTLINWRKKNPEFVLALKDDWKKVADHRVERSLYERSCGYEHLETKAQWVQDESGSRWETLDMVKHYPPDPTSMIFWLKNRQPQKWRDKHDLDITDTRMVQAILSSLPAEIREQVKASIKARAGK